MSDDRDRIQQTAEKLVARGKLPQAIKELGKILRANPDDVNTLNKVGDLHARLGDSEEAIRVFGRLAERYGRDGFFVKAIAIYKKMVRLDPTRIVFHEKLAEQYHRQGLVSEARSQYQVVADYHLSHADRPSALEALRQIAEVEPGNPSHRLRLADFYLEDGLVEEAIGEYGRIAELMLEQDAVEDATKVYVGALDLDASDLDFVSEAVLRLRDEGHAEAADKVFAAAVERNPEAARLEERMRSLDRSVAAESVEGSGASSAVELLPGLPVDDAEETGLPGGRVSAEELEEIAASVDLPEIESAAEGAYVIDLDEAQPAGPEPPVEPFPGDVGDEIEVDLDLAELEAGGVVEAVDVPGTAPSPPPVVPKAEEAPPADRMNELLAEAEVFSKYGLERKAVRRLEQALEIDPSAAVVHRRLVLMSLEGGRESEVIRLAERMLANVPDDVGGSFWSEVLGRLSEAGFVFRDGKLVVGQPSADAGPPAEPAAAVDDEDAGLEWLREPAAEPEGPTILFEAEEEFFDLAAELEKELVEESALEASAAEADVSEGVSVEEESIADIVDGFKKGVAEVLSPEAYDTHYNLGIAYREMGLVDEAIGEFQLSAKDQAHLVDSCSMLGACFLEKGFPDLAVKWYKRGLEEDLSEEESLSLLYDLGSVHAVSGDRAAAYEVFVEIYGINSHYRDVVARLEELRCD